MSSRWITVIEQIDPEGALLGARRRGASAWAWKLERGAAVLSDGAPTFNIQKISRMRRVIVLSHDDDYSPHDEGDPERLLPARRATGLSVFHTGKMVASWMWYGNEHELDVREPVAEFVDALGAAVDAQRLSAAMLRQNEPLEAIDDAAAALGLTGLTACLRIHAPAPAGALQVKTDDKIGIWKAIRMSLQLAGRRPDA